MTETRTAPFAFVGGPYDGVQLAVPVDEDGTPDELFIVQDITSPNVTRNPATMLQADNLRATYERDEALGDAGFTYVFRFRGQDVLKTAA
jgi:hypothetical protein